ncbi:MAG: ATP-dependent DNA helicase [Clostridia bacterium]|nr:ATP-dependent DNA helicase [Clostridia bacterium]
MPDTFRVNVRTLAEFCTEGGDLVRTGNLMERMREGVRGHQKIQSAYPEGWEREVSLSLDVEAEGLSLRLYGRADGLCRSCTPPVIEEIKTTERPVDSISPDDVPAHWAQAELYGAMLAEREEHPFVELRLTYLNLTGGKISFTRTFSREQLTAKMHACAAPYAKWLMTIEGWKSVSRPTMRSLPFPFDQYRRGQREMAANIYIALRDGRRLLCEAPTGIGKTAASIYPALKALGEDRIGRIFFLTARTTGQRSAESALIRMRKKGLIVRSVTISARDKVCIRPDGVCSPETCPRAKGYFDRRRAALCDSMSVQDLSASAIGELAEKHELCPFEFSLDLSETADIVVCDYNYAFDPRVRLQRFFTGKSDAALLIDEAHNLAARARSMLSSSLNHKDFRDLRARIGKESGRKHPLYKALTPLLQAFKDLRASIESETTLLQPPESLVDAVRAAMPLLGEQLNAPLPYSGELADCFFALTDFIRCAEGYTEDFRTLLIPDGKSMTQVTLWCVNPAPYLDKAMKRVHGAALFSATLSPLPFYRDLTGLSDEAGDAMLSLPSPFPPENLLVMCAPLPVRFRQREQSMPQLARYLIAFLTAHTGNFMVFFPSYIYMAQAVEALTPLLPGSVRLIIQSRDMDDEARAEFLSAFQPAPETTLCGMAVLGGAFSEGIDLPDDLLTGVAVVGTGVPQLSPANDALKEVYEERFSDGYRYAYMYPGVSKVLQAAGRVIRTETDRGAVLLIDSRWQSADHARLLPTDWKVRTVRSEREISLRMSEFLKYQK